MKNNEQRLKEIFAETLEVDKEIIINNLMYNSIPEWDSVSHMALVAEIEDSFNIMLDTDDVLDMNSFAKVKEILSKYEIKF